MSLSKLKALRRQLDRPRQSEIMKAIWAERTCQACSTTFQDRELYEQHVARRERLGFCLGAVPSEGPGQPGGSPGQTAPSAVGGAGQ